MGRAYFSVYILFTFSLGIYNVSIRIDLSHLYILSQSIVTMLIVIFSTMLVLSVGTMHGAPTKRQNSTDEELLPSLIRSVLMLGYLATGSKVGVFIYVYNNNYAAFHLSQVDNMNNESTKVLLAVCVLRNITWSRENLSVMEFDALMAIKDAVVINSCAWVW